MKPQLFSEGHSNRDIRVKPQLLVSESHRVKPQLLVSEGQGNGHVRVKATAVGQ